MKSFEERKRAVFARAEEKKKAGILARRRAMTTLSSLCVVAILLVAFGRLPSGNRGEGIPSLDKDNVGGAMEGLTPTPSITGDLTGDDPSSNAGDAGVEVEGIAQGGVTAEPTPGGKPSNDESGDEGVTTPAVSVQGSITEGSYQTPADTTRDRPSTTTTAASPSTTVAVTTSPSTTEGTTSPETLTTTEGDTLPEILTTTSDIPVTDPETTFEVILDDVGGLTLPNDADEILRIGGSGELASDLIDRFGAPSEGSLPVLCLTSKDELGIFLDVLSSKPFHYHIDGIYERVPCYDEAFFEAYDLIVVGFIASSGGDRFALQELGLSPDRLHLGIAKTQSGMTADMADWLLLLTMPKEATASVTRFTAEIDDLP